MADRAADRIATFGGRVTVVRSRPAQAKVELRPKSGQEIGRVVGKIFHASLDAPTAG
jgi:hypothetical protein